MLQDLDTNFPSFTIETDSEKIDKIMNYLYMLLENLKYSLRNLDETNFNQVSLSNITEPVKIQIEGLEGEVAALEITAAGLSSRVTSAEGDISSLEQTATGLTSRVTSAEGNITTLQQTSTSLTSRVTSAEGDINSIEQTLGGVAFKSSLAAGTTVINGGCISTGTIDAQYIGTGTLKVGDNSSDGAIWFSTYTDVANQYAKASTIGGERELELGSALGGIVLTCTNRVYIDSGASTNDFSGLNISEYCYGDTLPGTSDAAEGDIFFLI